MIVEDFLARLEKVRPKGASAWSARCPAHADKSPSLSIKDNDGTILLHCFAGCSASEIAIAAGIQLHELFPPRDPREQAIYRRDKFAKAGLKDLRHELTVALIILGDVTSGREIKPADIERAKRAKASILKAITEMPE